MSRLAHALLGGLFAVAGCASPAAAPPPQRAAAAPASSQPRSYEELVAVAKEEALRLLEETLHIDGRVDDVADVSDVTEGPGGAAAFVVSFAGVTDTSAAIVVDRRSGAIRSSSIGGGL